MRARSFSHVGITVSDFNRAVRFYWDVFGCPLVGVSEHPPERIRTFFRIPDGQSLRIGWIRVPGGAVLEIFEFQPQQPAAAVRPARRPRCRVRDPARTLAARSVVLLREGHGRQPDRTDGSRLHVPRTWLARPAGRLDLPPWDVREVLPVADDTMPTV